MHGTPLIERLIKIFNSHNSESISIIINGQQPDTLALLEKLSNEYPLNIVVKDTPRSMHSLYEMREHLRGGKFCLTTVDTIFDEKEFAEYIKSFETSTDDGVMAVTPFIDDEKPLYVGTDEKDGNHRLLRRASQRQPPHFGRNIRAARECPRRS